MSKTTTFPTDYRQYLEESLAARRLKNQNYSQAAFARDLALSPSTLSELMKGKYGLSPERAEMVAQKLKLDSLHCAHFVDLLRAKFARNAEIRNSADTNARQRQKLREQQVSLDKFKTISEWHHLALLELFETSDFVFEREVVSQRLGITLDEVDESIARLLRLELLEGVGKRIKPTGQFTTVESHLASEAIRKYQTDLIQKAVHSIDVQSREDRDLSSVVFSFSKEDMVAAKKELQDFRRHFASKFSKNLKKEDVYCLSLQMFSLTSGASQ